MKKKILFIIPNLKSGGAEKSLVTLLQLFDYERYDVSLFLFRKEGLFLDCIPEQVKIITAGKNFELFDGDAVTAARSFLKKGRLDLTFTRFLYTKSLEKNDGYKREVGLWKHMKKTLDYPKEHYDCVIGYLEGPSNWLAADLPAPKKIGYMHSYLDETNSDKLNFKKNILKFNYFVAVSEKCLDNLKCLVPEYNGFVEINNIISPGFIYASAKKDCPFKDETVRILTVGRLSFEKGTDIAVEACMHLKKHISNFKWYHLGSGIEKENIINYIKQNDLEEDFILLGEKENPYPYFGNCDIYVQPSRYEGKSIAIDEAKCLQKPIVVTNFPSVYDQIQDGVNGLICEMNAQSVADAVERLILDPQLRKTLSENLSHEKIGNEEEIQKLYELIES